MPVDDISEIRGPGGDARLVYRRGGRWFYLISPWDDRSVPIGPFLTREAAVAHSGGHAVGGGE